MNVLDLALTSNILKGLFVLSKRTRIEIREM